jgi:hypothetical protein
MSNNDELLENRKRLTDELIAQGHELGEWVSCMNGEGYQTRCLKCHGFIGIGLHGERGGGRKDNRLGMVMRDPFTSLNYCPADDEALMKQLNDEWGRRLAQVAKILIESGRREREKRLSV